MTIDGLKEWLDAAPFQAFTMRLTNGEEITVKHPEVVARSQSGRVIVVFTNGDRFKMVDLLHVTSIEQANGKRSSNGNGGGRRGKSK